MPDIISDKMWEAAAALTTAQAQAQAAAQEQRIAELEGALRIGDKVRVIGEYEADWQRIDAWIVGMSMDEKGLNYTLGEQWPVRSRHSAGYLGPTDGFREGDLVRAILERQADT